MSSTSRRRSRGQSTVDGDDVTNTFGAEDIIEDAGEDDSGDDDASVSRDEETEMIMSKVVSDRSAVTYLNQNVRLCCGSLMMKQ